MIPRPLDFDKKNCPICQPTREREGKFFIWCLVALLHVALLFFEHHLCFSDERALEQIKNEFVVLEKSDGRPPNYVDLYRLAFQDGRELTVEEFDALISFVLSRQNPPVSRDHVVTLIKSKRRAITSFRAEFTRRQVTFNRNLEETIDENYTYAICMLNNWHMIDSTIMNGQKRREVNSYNGENFLRLVFTDNGTPNLLVQEKGQILSFFLLFAPLQQSMLFDTVSFSMPHAWFDSVHFFESRNPKVFENKEEINGRECILVASPSLLVFLDPGLDFAVTKIEGFETKLRAENSNIVITGMDLTAKRVLSNFRDYGNSLWLPSDIVNEYYADGVIARKDFIQIKKIEINPKLGKDYFTNIAPEDAFVIDGTRGIVYEGGRTINDLLKSVAKSKRQWFWQYASMTTGIILIIIWIIIKYMKYRAYLKAKNAE
jgi:hypothetical protein